jgi:hypothetical protein
VGGEIELINNLKKIIIGGKRGMDDTCAKENI